MSFLEFLSYFGFLKSQKVTFLDFGSPGPAVSGSKYRKYVILAVSGKNCSQTVVINIADLNCTRTYGIYMNLFRYVLVDPELYIDLY